VQRTFSSPPNHLKLIERKRTLARNSAYLSPVNRPGVARVFAHRGLALGADGPMADENTIAAFEAAIAAGADYLESDIQVTADSVAVLFHDDDLWRIAADSRKISEITWGELSNLVLPMGQRIPTLEQALTSLPDARFNLDFKVAGAIGPATEVINRVEAGDRILATSFSEKRRKAATRLISQPVAESAGSIRVLGLYLTYSLGLDGLFRRLASAVDCLQIPVRASVMKFGTERFIASAKRAGLEVHFWTINDPDQMRELILLGADGLVTDRADLARQVVDSLS